MPNARKILVVDDDADLRDALMEQLSLHEEFVASAADTGAKGIASARADAPDLIIMDIQLPHVSGLDLIRMIRKDKKLSRVPIMAVTAYSARGDEERIRAAGAQAYVSKPISVMRFAETVDQLLAEGSGVAGSSQDNH